ncbi:MAG: biotin--[acetyl-CoA-carboxylase] ligase [Phycisphaeraceae bacterium]
MTPAADETDLAEWQDALEAAFVSRGIGPMAVRVYRRTASTQDVAKSFAPGPALILADQQTAGRGRLGRSWLSEPGASVLMSLVYPDPMSGPTHDRVSMLAGVAVAQAVQRLAPGLPVRLKWPNDVMIDGRKLAGILIESIAKSSIIGVGLNVRAVRADDASVPAEAVSLEELGYASDRLTIVEAVVVRLVAVLGEADPQGTLEQWRALASLGQTQTFEQAGHRVTGEVLDLDPDHGLIVRRDSGEIVTLPAATTSVVK